MNRFSRLVVAIVALFVVAAAQSCAVPRPNQEASTRSSATIQAGTDKRDDRKHVITEVGLERTACFGNCPVYTLVIQCDGNFRYHGEKWVRRGDFTGKIAKGRWEKLVAAALDAGYMDLENDYDARVTDMPNVYTTVVMDGKKKTIRDYANAAPEKLQEFERLLFESLEDARWNEKGPDAVPKSGN